MSNYANRLGRLEDAIRPAVEPIHILRVIIDPFAPDSALSAIALCGDGSRRYFTREPGESKDALCERARRAMGRPQCRRSRRVNLGDPFGLALPAMPDCASTWGFVTGYCAR
jgi:hypothetical protein